MLSSSHSMKAPIQRQASPSPRATSISALSRRRAEYPPGSPQSISLSGTAIAPALQISPASLTFAAQSVATPSPSQTITLSSTATSSVTINGIIITGANAGDFSENGNCSALLGAGASCQVTVIFKPTAAGNRSASISISDNAAGNPHSIPLAGTATQAAVSLSPSTVNFANQLVGTASAAVALTVTNTGTGALVIGSISFSGTNAADFTQKNTCTAPVAPATTCLINVTFTPTAVGSRTATMVLADNASNAPQSVPLTGTAMNFVIDPPSVSATSATVTAGQTATYQLNLQSIDGFAGPVTLTCSGAPVGATCTVIPTPITLTANATTPFQVQVTTTAGPATANLLPIQMPLSAHSSPGPQTPPSSRTPTPSFQQLHIAPETNAPQSSSPLSITTRVSTVFLSPIALPKPDSGFRARAKRSVLFAMALRTAGVSLAPLTLPFAPESQIQIRRLADSSFALMALIAVSIALWIAIARILAPQIPLISLILPITHSHHRHLRGDHQNADFLPGFLADSLRCASRCLHRIAVAAARPGLLPPSLHHHGQLRQLGSESVSGNFPVESHAGSQRRLGDRANRIKAAVPERGLRQRFLNSQLRNEAENRDFAPESLADSHQGAKGGINNAKFTMTEPAPPRSLSQARHSKSATRHTCGQQTPKLHLSTSSAAATALAIALTLLTLSCGSPNSTTQPSATPTGTYLLTLTSTSPQASSPPTQSLIVTIH